jgi:tetratricopeptide (TPR) repeat protein
MACVTALLAGAVCLAAQTLSRAEELYKHTEYEGSLALLDASSHDPQISFLIGRNYFMLGDFKKATDYLERAATADPNNSEYMDWQGRAYGKRAETSNPFAATRFASKTRQAFEKSVALDPKNEEALSDLFEYYLDAPGFLGGGYEKAWNVAEKISEIDPSEGYFSKAQLEQKRREFDTAEQHLRQAVSLAPHEISRLIQLAKFLANQGRIPESDAVFVQAQRLNPSSPRLWFARADVLVKQKRNLDEARNLLQKYIQAPITADDPSRDEARRLLKQAQGG